MAQFLEDGVKTWKRVTGNDLITRRQAIHGVVEQWGAGRRAQIHTPKNTTSA